MSKGGAFDLKRDPSLEFKIISKHRMVSHYLPKLKICLEHLDFNLIWHKESEDLNSIGGIVLHVVEHLNRNTIRLRNPDAKFNKGIENHFPYMEQDIAIIIEELDRTFSEFETAMNNLSSDQIDIYNIYHLVEHTGYHLGQIIDRAQRITGLRFQFVQNGLNEKELKKIIEDEIEEIGK
jgi:hypothetical protein